jgi:hypothetical protein
MVLKTTKNVHTKIVCIKRMLPPSRGDATELKEPGPMLRKWATTWKTCGKLAMEDGQYAAVS